MRMAVVSLQQTPETTPVVRMGYEHPSLPQWHRDVSIVQEEIAHQTDIGNDRLTTAPALHCPFVPQPRPAMQGLPVGNLPRSLADFLRNNKHKIKKFYRTKALVPCSAHRLTGYWPTMYVNIGKELVQLRYTVFLSQIIYQKRVAGYPDGDKGQSPNPDYLSLKVTESSPGRSGMLSVDRSE